MDKLKRAALPALVFIVILASLVYRLSSCAPNKNSTAAEASASLVSASVTPSIGTNPLPSTASPTPPYLDSEIKSIYSSLGLTVVEIRGAGDATMVHYYRPTGVAGEIISRFDWFNRSTGARDLVYGWAYTDKFEIKADKSFTVLTTGLSFVDGTLAFPQIFRSSYSDVDGAVRFTGADEKYYAPLEKSYTVGSDRHECLAGLYLTTGTVSLGFSPQPGFESEFYADYESIPKITVKNDAGISTITLFKTILSKNFKQPSDKDNAYCSFLSVTSDGTDTVIKLKLKADAVTRYNVSTDRSPESGLPYAVFEYTKMDYDYPSGW